MNRALNILRTPYDFAFEPTLAEEPVLDHIKGSVRSMVNATLKLGFDSLKRIKDSVKVAALNFGSNAKNFPAKNPLRLAAHTIEAPINAANGAVEMAENTTLATAEAAATVNLEGVNAVDHMEMAARQLSNKVIGEIFGQMKIPFYTTAIRAVNATIFAIPNMLTKAARWPGKGINWLLEKVRPPLAKAHQYVREHTTIQAVPSSPAPAAPAAAPTSAPAPAPEALPAAT